MNTARRVYKPVKNEFIGTMSRDHVIAVFTPQNFIPGVNLDFCGFMVL
jgi:hypothetical protein